jgi:hypothetical protein
VGGSTRFSSLLSLLSLSSLTLTLASSLFSFSIFLFLFFSHCDFLQILELLREYMNNKEIEKSVFVVFERFEKKLQALQADEELRIFLMEFLINLFYFPFFILCCSLLWLAFFLLTFVFKEKKLEKDKETILKDLTSIGDDLINTIDSMKAKSDDALGISSPFLPPFHSPSLRPTQRLVPSIERICFFSKDSLTLPH